MKTIRNKKRQLIKVYFFLILIIPLILFLFWGNLNLFLKFLDLRNENSTLEEKIDLEKKEIEATTEALKKLDSQFGQDEILLEKFSRYKPGEKVIEILE